jgi:hypothetical protein
LTSWTELSNTALACWWLLTMWLANYFLQSSIYFLTSWRFAPFWWLLHTVFRLHAATIFSPYTIRPYTCITNFSGVLTLAHTVFNTHCNYYVLSISLLLRDERICIIAMNVFSVPLYLSPLYCLQYHIWSIYGKSAKIL